MRLESVRNVGEKSHKTFIENWGDTVTIVDFGYDSDGAITSAMIVTRNGLSDIRMSTTKYINDDHLVLDDLLFYYTPDPGDFPQIAQYPADAE